MVITSKTNPQIKEIAKLNDKNTADFWDGISSRELNPYGNVLRRAAKF